MSFFGTTSQTKNAKLSVVVTRADGSVKRRSLVAYQSSNPIKHFVVNLYISIDKKRWARKDRKEAAKS